MSEMPTSRPRPTEEGFKFRARAAARFVMRGRVAPRALAAAALVLLVALPAYMMLAQKPQPARRQAALASLNSYLDNTIHPAEMSQAKGLNRQQFSAWLKRARLPLGVKGAYRGWLGPVLTAPRFATVLLRGVSLKEGGKVNLVLVGIPPSLRPKYDGVSLVIIREPWGDGDSATDSNVNGGSANGNGGGNGNDNGNGNGGIGNGNGNGGIDNNNGNGNGNSNSNTIKVDGCRYRSCFCANPDNCLCQSTFRSETPCPANECTTSADCGSGGGGGGSGNFDIFEALTTF